MDLAQCSGQKEELGLGLRWHHLTCLQPLNLEAVRVKSVVVPKGSVLALRRCLKGAKKANLAPQERSRAHYQPEEGAVVSRHPLTNKLCSPGLSRVISQIRRCSYLSKAEKPVSGNSYALTSRPAFSTGCGLHL